MTHKHRLAYVLLTHQPGHTKFGAVQAKSYGFSRERISVGNDWSLLREGVRRRKWLRELWHASSVRLYFLCVSHTWSIIVSAKSVLQRALGGVSESFRIKGKQLEHG